MRTVCLKAFTAGLLLSILALNLPAQLPPCLFHQEKHPVADIRYSIGFESNALSNHFVNQIRKGSYLAGQEVEDVYASLSHRNLAGYHSALQSTLWLPAKSSGIGHYFGLRNQHLIEASFKPEIFGLVFLGNQRFAGSEVYLADQKFRQIKTQSLNAGIYKLISSEELQILYGGGLALLKGQYLHDIDVKGGSFFTSLSGDEIRIDMHYNYTRSDTQYTRYFDMNGYGLGLDFFFDLRGDDGTRISFDISNLGALRWVYNRYNYEKDSSFAFKGWEVPNLFELSGKVFETATPDSLFSVISSANGNSNRWIPHPALVRADVASPLGIDWLRMRIHAEHLLFSSRTPYISGGPELIAYGGILSIHPYISAGGYGRPAAGLHADLHTTNHWHFRLGSRSIDGFLFPKKRIGQSVYLSVSHLF